MGISIKDIAGELGLSNATVSWILSGQGEKKGFSEKTIARVKEYAASVNYRPNQVARSLSLGVTKTLGLIIPFLRDTFYARMAYDIERYASSKGYSLIVCSSEGDGDKERMLMEALTANRVDGLIVAPTKTSMSGVTSLYNQNFPFVLIDRFYCELDTNYVIVNNYKGGYDVTSYLAKRGAKKIAIVVADTHIYVVKRRIKGYADALADNGMSYSDSLEVYVDRKTYNTDIVAKLDRLFAEEPDVDGFFFVTHYLAMAAIRYFVSKNIDYHKFAMGCFDIMDGLDVLAPEMCSVLFPISDMCRNAVDILLESISTKCKMPTRKEMLECVLTPRIG